MKLLSTTLSCALLLTLSVTGHAEEAKNSTSKNSSAALEQFFAGKLMLMNHSTILMSDMAARETSSDEIKQFANKLHEAHAAMNRKLTDVAPDIAAITTLDSAGKPHASGFRGTPPTERQSQVGEPEQKRHADGRLSEKQFDSPLHHILSIQREAAENYLQTSTEMLSKYDGQDFDMGFLGFQIGQHTWALAELRAMKSVGDENFQNLVDEAAKHLEQHLSEARQLSKKFEDDTAQNRDTSRP